MDDRVAAAQMAGKLAGIGRRSDAADRAPALVDHLRGTADEIDAVMAIEEGKLLRQPIGPRNVVGVEPREVGRARCGYAEIERSSDPLRRLVQQAHAVVAEESIEQAHGAVVGSVVDDDELEIAKLLIEHAIDRFAQPSRAVAHRHED
jgi:hypothetical protein